MSSYRGYLFLFNLRLFLSLGLFKEQKSWLLEREQKIKSWLYKIQSQEQNLATWLNNTRKRGLIS